MKLAGHEIPFPPHPEVSSHPWSGGGHLPFFKKFVPHRFTWQQTADSEGASTIGQESDGVSSWNDGNKKINVTNVSKEIQYQTIFGRTFWLACKRGNRWWNLRPVCATASAAKREFPHPLAKACRPNFYLSEWPWVSRRGPFSGYSDALLLFGENLSVHRGVRAGGRWFGLQTYAELPEKGFTHFRVAVWIADPSMRGKDCMGASFFFPPPLSPAKPRFFRLHWALSESFHRTPARKNIFRFASFMTPRLKKNTRRILTVGLFALDFLVSPWGDKLGLFKK